MIEIIGKHNTATVFTDTLEDRAEEEIRAVCNRPEFSKSKIRIMPDVHAGLGCTIGTTMTIEDKVVPSMVGVDIGCGMETVELEKCKLDLQILDDVIRKYIPSGRNIHPSRQVVFSKLQDLKCFRELRDTHKFEKALGSLGGGNHFIEVAIDESDNKYLVIHSGSRNLGHQVASYYQNLSYDLLRGKGELLKQKEELISDYKTKNKHKEIQEALKKLDSNFKMTHTDIPKDLAYLTGKYKEDYIHDMNICQEYAINNRRMIISIILREIKTDISAISYNYNKLMNGSFDEYYHSFSTIHNYIEIDSMILRKGAVSAKAGEKLLIPINMRDGSLICIGKGNADWNYSAPHGAGRIMSRRAAFDALSVEDFKISMDGIFTSCVNEKTLDESPMAYKNIEDITKHIGPTVGIIKHIKPIYNFKASE